MYGLDCESQESAGGGGADAPEGEQRVASWGAWEVRGAQSHLSSLVNMTTVVR